MLKKRPLKILNLLHLIKQCIESGRYRSCLHLEQRENERQITRREVLYILEHGFHEKHKDGFDEGYQIWHYAIRGKTLDNRDLRVYVAIDPEPMMIIITAYDLEG